MLLLILQAQAHRLWNLKVLSTSNSMLRTQLMALSQEMMLPTHAQYSSRDAELHRLHQASGGKHLVMTDDSACTPAPRSDIRFIIADCCSWFMCSMAPFSHSVMALLK